MSSGTSASARRTRQSRDASANMENQETTPLLRNEDTDRSDAGDATNTNASAASSILDAIRHQGKRKRYGVKSRWPSLLALFVLCVVIVFILVCGFVAPNVISEYGEQARVFNPKSFSLEKLTSTGFKARIQGTFVLDGSRVKRKSARDLGRVFTAIARKVETGETYIHVDLPEYGLMRLGSAHIPPIVFDVRDLHPTEIDIVAEIVPGNEGALRQIATDVVAGRVEHVRLQAGGKVPIKSGIFSFGTQTITGAVVFQSNDIPSVPKYDIKDISINEAILPDGNKGLIADISVNATNDFPVNFRIPALGFGILAPGCTPTDPKIMIGDARTAVVHVKPKQDIEVNARGYIRRFPDAFLSPCPRTKTSPFDQFVGSYIHGEKTVLYIQGSDSPSLDTPSWISDLISEITVPVELPGSSFDNLIKSFTLSHTKFHLPDFFAEPGTEDGNPKVSAEVKALIRMPDEMNFALDVQQVRANADVFYKKEKFGMLDLHKWQPAKSRMVADPDSKSSDLEVSANFTKAPLIITNEDVFTSVMTQLLTSSDTIYLTVKAEVDVEAGAGLGTFTAKKIPAEGVVPVNPVSGGDFKSFSPKISDLNIVDTSVNSLTLEASIGFNNPTNYSAVVPYININILVNNTILGNATVRDVTIVPGHNSDIKATAVWQPTNVEGDRGAAVGRELLSQYISGYNTTLTLKTHEGTIPAQPAIGKALEKLNVTLPTPRLGKPGEGGGGDDGPHFITDAKMHLFTSTASFIVISPLKHATLYLTSIDATAFYKEDPVGKIIFDEEEIEVPPGSSETPPLPVQWSLNSLGYEAILKALGGSLKLSTKADVGVRLGSFEESIWFEGHGLGVAIRP